MWGQALLVWSLMELDSFLGEDRFLDFCAEYCAFYAARPPAVDQSDTCAPGLAAQAVYRRTGDPACRLLAERAIAYVRSEPRLVGEAPNHLGHSFESRLYPKSVWVDSLMMFGLFAARWAEGSDDPELLAFAGRQPGLYARLLQDESTGLFRHAYWARRAEAFPRDAVFWGRGNGWVAAALPLIADCLPAHSPERASIASILARQAAALAPLQRPDGWWSTLLEPASATGRGGAYREASATALVAAGWARSVRTGLLHQRYAEPARRAFAALVASLGPAGETPAMRETSAPTVPLPLFPRLGYALVPRGRDLSYGLAALFLAAIEVEKLDGERSSA